MALGMPAPGYSKLTPGSKGASRQGIANRYFPGGQTAQRQNSFSQSNPYTQPYQQAMGAYGALYGPDMTAAQNSAARANALLPVQAANYDTRRQGEYGSYDIGMRSVGLNEAGLNIDRGANARDRDYYQNLLNILGEQRNVVGDTFNNQLRELQQRAATEVRGTNQEATAAGAWLAPERNQRVLDTFGSYETGKQSADLARRSSLLGLGKEEFGLKKSQAETHDRDAKLDIMAKQYGLDREKLKLNLDQGLANLGYQQFIDTNSLLDKIDSSNAAEAAVARQILESVMQSGEAFNSGAVGDYYTKGFYNPSR